MRTPFSSLRNLRRAWPRRDRIPMTPVRVDEAEYRIVTGDLGGLLVGVLLRLRLRAQLDARFIATIAATEGAEVRVGRRGNDG